MNLETAKALSDKDLINTLHQTLASERDTVANSVACLVAIVERDLHFRQGASSLFDFLTRLMKMSESCASKRSAAVRAVSRFPDLLDLIRSGDLHLSHVSLIAKHLTPDNKDRLVGMARRCTHRALESLLAAEFSKPVHRDVIRPVVIPAVMSMLASDSVLSPPQAKTRDLFALVVAPVVERPTPVTPPVQEVGLRVAVTLDATTADALGYLRKTMPGKSVADILARAVCELRDRRDPERRVVRATKRVNAKQDKSIPSQPQASRTAKSTARAIPAAMRRTVFARDGYRCTFVSPDGCRCDARHGLELDHVKPFAWGGETSLENLRARCKSHNNLEAKDLMGRQFIESHYRRNTQSTFRAESR